MRKPMLILAALGALMAAAPASGQAFRASQDRQEAFRGVREGNIVPLHVVRERAAAMYPDAQIIGADLIGSVYRLRLMRGPHLLMVDFDARNGQPLRCMGRCR